MRIVAGTAGMPEEPLKKNTLKTHFPFASQWGCLRNHEELFSCLFGWRWSKINISFNKQFASMFFFWKLNLFCLKRKYWNCDIFQLIFSNKFKTINQESAYVLFFNFTHIYFMNKILINLLPYLELFTLLNSTISKKCVPV